MKAKPMLDSGMVCGDYVVDSRLESFDDEEIYLARHGEHGTWHALKVLDQVDSRRRMRLEQEAVFRDELRHPNIVPATECIDVDGRPALVMEFVEGPSMQAWLAECRPLADKLSLFRGIVEGVRHAHSHQVIHRGLTPGNVMLQPGAGNTWIPRICDFGLAKALAPEMGKYGGLTTINTSLGPVGYAAPEQCRDASAVTPAADLFSLGCILYEMTCGVDPFNGLSAFDALAAKSGEQYPPPSHVAPGLPTELYELIDRLLAARPEARPAGCDAVLAALDPIYDQVAPPPSSIRLAAMPLAPAPDEPQVELQTVLVMCGIPLVALLVGLVVVFAP